MKTENRDVEPVSRSRFGKWYWPLTGLLHFESGSESGTEIDRLRIPDREEILQLQRETILKWRLALSSSPFFSLSFCVLVDNLFFDFVLRDFDRRHLNSSIFFPTQLDTMQ